MKGTHLFKHFATFACTIPAYLFIWYGAKQVNEPSMYILLGVSLMLWPVQIAFWFGQRHPNPPSPPKS